MLMVMVGSLFQEAGAIKHSLAFNHMPQKVVFSCLEKMSLSSHHNSTSFFVGFLFNSMQSHNTLNIDGFFAVPVIYCSFLSPIQRYNKT